MLDRCGEYYVLLCMWMRCGERATWRGHFVQHMLLLFPALATVQRSRQLRKIKGCAVWSLLSASSHGWKTLAPPENCTRLQDAAIYCINFNEVRQPTRVST
mmetsp:Transcript_8185/g.22627  ORF Transcript_8185/g.22627 Transcript_8185/m.22627 type:complete len:101 (-) Transcript_8185:111-413(-)